MKKFFANKVHMKWYWTLLVLGLGFVVTFFGGVALQVGSLKATLSNFLLHPILIALNGLPIGVLLLVLYAIFGNAFHAGAVTSLLIQLMSLVNRIKIEARYDPFVPSDFTLLGEAATATGEYRLNLHIPFLLAIVGFALVMFLLGIKFKSARPKWYLRALLGLAAVGLFAFSMVRYYSNKDLYEFLTTSTPGVSQINVPTAFDGLGFNYCFLHNFNLYTIERPADYSTEEAAAWAAKSDAPAPQPKVNLIFVQGEAFSDIMLDPVFGWEETENPLYEYTLVANSDRAISGHIIVSNYGAGTANTEFDVITGMPTTLISAGNTSAFRVVRRNVPSLARTLQSAGYQNYFMHPGQPWFYNRENVYRFFGVEDQTFIDAFDGYEWKGQTVSDAAFGQKLIEDYEQRKAASDAPLFAITVTMQNHQAYPYSKYDEPLPPAKIDRDVQDETMEMITVYAEGIRDTAHLLTELTEYFDREEEPTVLVFWGDHLPALGANFSVYRDLGLDVGRNETLQETLHTYMTPFTVWGNEAFCREYDMAALQEALDLPDNATISDFYLGELVYEMLGLQGTDPYFDFLGELRREMPVMRPGCCLLGDGTMTDTLTDAQEALVSKLNRWEYYRLKDERVETQ